MVNPTINLISEAYYLYTNIGYMPHHYILRVLNNYPLFLCLLFYFIILWQLTIVTNLIIVNKYIENNKLQIHVLLLTVL
jgi:hypothetical protein